MIQIKSKQIYSGDWSCSLEYHVNSFIEETLPLMKKEGYTLERYELFPPQLSHENYTNYESGRPSYDTPTTHEISGAIILYFKQLPLAQVLNS